MIIRSAPRRRAAITPHKPTAPSPITAAVLPGPTLAETADAEESGIPAAYTYFGQFIDHDLTFDPASSLQRQNDPDALFDYRTPRYDLDSLYGRGPADDPFMYDHQTGTPRLNGVLFLIGRDVGNGRDLQRNDEGR